MASNSLEDLLQEALADFEEPQHGPTSGFQVNLEVPSPAPSDSEQAASRAQHAGGPIVTSAPHKPAPKGLGLGLGGSDLLNRRPRKPVGGPAAAVAAPADSQGLEQEDISSGGGATAAAKPPQKLRPEAQRLADDVLGFLREAGLAGEGTEPQETFSLEDLFGRAGNLGAAGGGLAAGHGGDAAGLPGLASGISGSTAGPSARAEDDDPFAQLFGRILGGLAPSGGQAGDDGTLPPEFAAALQHLTSEVSGADVLPTRLASGVGGAPGAGPSTSGSAAGTTDNDDALASSRLRGLAQQTLKTVSQQAKKTRGHVEDAAAGRAGAAGPLGGGGLPFGGAASGGGLASILRELGGMGLPGVGGEGGEGAAPAGVNMMVDYIMQHLLSKDVLYGPLKEIRDRYPPWLDANQGTLPAEEFRRYVAQYESVQRVCAHYETSPSDFAKLMTLIQEMQTYGDPPGDIVEEMTGGAGRDINAILNAGEEDGLPAGEQPALDELSSELDKCKVQ
ncbi:hypothetical protein Vafri_17092 [Volvox africanus]|uniref:Uncharacterized protein n=1 Tax=Volvox africanus TaxID=51714 RepID=A0A8J4BJI2_9CHLO|nr:hypothetical protein Vafri_17092 [Volvox africanus]